MTIGIAVALYNGSRFLREQLDSLRMQTISADTVVFCDDGSTDNTKEIVKNYIEEFDLSSSWTLVQNEDNLGYARNFYKAMDLCGTDIIFLCDQDDIWCPDKLEKMTAVMEKEQHICLLASKFGMIDADGNVLHGLLEKRSKQTETLTKVTAESILKAYYWPGMIMCIRGDFFRELLVYIKNHKVPHDFVLAYSAAVSNGFFEYDYIGAFHRRHGNNAAKEEHRIFSLLNIERKKAEMKTYNEMLADFLAMNLPFPKKFVDLVQHRLELSQTREKAVINRDLRLLFRLYKDRELLRFFSFICDLWLICFGY